MENDKVTVVLDRGTARLLARGWGEMLPSCEEALWDAVDSDESGQSHIAKQVLAAARKRVEGLRRGSGYGKYLGNAEGRDKALDEVLAAIGQDTGEGDEA